LKVRFGLAWHDAAPSDFRELFAGSRHTLPHMLMRCIKSLPSTATPITRRYISYRYIPRFSTSNIGRKHKGHRQQAQQERPWRNAEKGRRSKGKGRRGIMGQDESRVMDPSAPPRTLKARTVEALAQYIKDGRAQKIVVMVGSSPRYGPAHALTIGRQGQASARRRVYQTSGRRRQVYTRTSRALSSHTLRPSSTSPSSATIPNLSTPLRKNYTPASSDRQLRTHS
jgi:hypothetical protein